MGTKRPLCFSIIMEKFYSYQRFYSYHSESKSNKDYRMKVPNRILSISSLNKIGYGFKKTERSDQENDLPVSDLICQIDYQSDSKKALWN